MRLLKIVLPDTSYQIASELAQIEQVEIGQFAAGVLSDALTAMYQKKPPSGSPPRPSTQPTPPGYRVTLTQLLELCRSVWQDGKDFNEAVRATAAKFGVRQATVRDKCTRRIDLPSTSRFLELMRIPSHLIDHLRRRFPRHATQIESQFGSILPSSEPPNAPPPLPRTPPPPREASEIELVTAIIAVLKQHGGKLDKPDVERELFEQYKTLFQKPWYQGEVGGGIPRWQKNVQFARNTACNKLRLLKPPDQAGRGVWELSEKGWHWNMP